MGTDFPLRLRDRDAVISEEGIIFRVYGYFHPPDGYVCDVEYAPSEIYASSEARALRRKGSETFYKFYGDEGLKFVLENYPGYVLFHEPLQRSLVGVPNQLVASVRRPERRLQELLGEEPHDELLASLHSLIALVADQSDLSVADFGVFGSLLHGFYHPKFSDIDLVVYGRRQLEELREVLGELYERADSSLRNEFESEKTMKGKRWRFLNYSLKEFLFHQKRKMVYVIFHDETAGRPIKVEFEPVKTWPEIFNEYDSRTRIVREGWIRAFARITGDEDAPFIPSIYQVGNVDVVEGPKVEDVTRIISYVEEFRMQACKDESVYVEGNLERVDKSNETYHQIILSYGPKYYEQVLKSVNMGE